MLHSRYRGGAARALALQGRGQPAEARQAGLHSPGKGLPVRAAMEGWACQPCFGAKLQVAHAAPAAGIWDMAGRAQTVCGPVDPAELGKTLAHEHLLIDLSWARDPRTASDRVFFEKPLDMDVCGCCRHYNMANKADLMLGSVDVAVSAMQRFRMAGGGAVVEPTSIGIGRDPLGLQEISRGSGVHVVMGTAFYVASVHPKELKDWTVAEIAKMLVDDIVYGATLSRQSPSSGTTTVHSSSSGVRAGIIGELGCSWPLHPDEAKVLQASAVAQRSTGAAISVHPGRDEAAPMEILRVLEAAGADLSRVVMCHIDRTVFKEHTLEEIAETGCYLEYDLFGMYQSGFYPHNPEVELLNDAGRVKQIQWLIAKGLGKRVLVSQDIAGNHRLSEWGGHGYHYLLKEVLPAMRARGMSEGQISDLFENNPQSVLTFAPVAASSVVADPVAGSSSKYVPRM